MLENEDSEVVSDMLEAIYKAQGGIKRQVSDVLDIMTNEFDEESDLYTKLKEIHEKCDAIYSSSNKKQPSVCASLDFSPKLKEILTHLQSIEKEVKTKEDTTTPWLRMNHWKGFVSVIGGVFLLQIIVTFAFLSIDSLRVSSDVFNTYQFGRKVAEVWPKMDAKDREKMSKLAIKG